MMLQRINYSEFHSFLIFFLYHHMLAGILAANMGVEDSSKQN